MQKAIDSWRKHTGASPVYWILLGVMLVAASPLGLFVWIGAMAFAAAVFEVIDRSNGYE